MEEPRPRQVQGCVKKSPLCGDLEELKARGEFKAMVAKDDIFG